MYRLEVAHLSNRALIAEFDSLVAGNHRSFAALLTRIAVQPECRIAAGVSSSYCEIWQMSSAVVRGAALALQVEAVGELEHLAEGGERLVDAPEDLQHVAEVVERVDAPPRVPVADRLRREDSSAARCRIEAVTSGGVRARSRRTGSEPREDRSI